MVISIGHIACYLFYCVTDTLCWLHASPTVNAAHLAQLSCKENLISVVHETGGVLKNL